MDLEASMRKSLDATQRTFNTIRTGRANPSLLDKMLGVLRQACDGGDTEAMLRQVRNLVPEFRPADEVNAEVAGSLARR